MGENAVLAKKELEETLRLTREDGPQKAMFYPEWLDEPFEFVTHWDVRTMLEYYSGIITPTVFASSMAFPISTSTPPTTSTTPRATGIHPKQIWSYMHGLSHPRKQQVHKIESALHALGKELMNISFEGQ